jgi:hypothetical protein
LAARSSFYLETGGSFFGSKRPCKTSFKYFSALSYMAISEWYVSRYSLAALASVVGFPRPFEFFFRHVVA